MYVFVFALIARVASERIHVVTPENLSRNELEGNATEDDTYFKAYLDVRATSAERRQPLGAYGDASYSTLSHSSYIDDDVYPDFRITHHKPHHHHHDSIVYGPPSPASHYYHHHHPQPVSTHHTFIGFPSTSHVFHSFLNKFGLNTVVKLIAKIAVLKIILKFVAMIALFFVLPSFMSKDKDKENEDERLLKNLNDVTERVWKGIAKKEMMDADVKPQQQPQKPDMDKEKDKDKEKEEEELDKTDMKLLKKLIKEWKDENFGGPNKGSAVSILIHCVNIVNRILTVMVGYLKMKHNNMDALDSLMLNKLSVYVKDIMKMWPKMKSVWYG